MSSKRRRTMIAVAVLASIAAAAVWLLWPAPRVPDQYSRAERSPAVDPDYDGCTIPPDIAPLNFTIREDGAGYCVHVRGDRGEPFTVAGRTPGIAMPPRQWRALLAANRGKHWYADVFVQAHDGRWRRFEAIGGTVSPDAIASYVAYRRLGPLHNVFTTMGAYQRDLSTFDESPILLSGPESRRCVNCHTFSGNRPDKMVLHSRGKGRGEMLLVADTRAKCIDTRTKLNPSLAGYITWHPDGRTLAFSGNSLVQFHHATGFNLDVFDYASDVCLYDTQTNQVIRCPQIADPDYLETLPSWSPDGKWLYFSRAPVFWPADAKKEKLIPPEFRRVRYDLYRVGYEPASGEFGKLERLLSSEATGLSITEPRISPDGKFLLFCMHPYGSFPVYQPQCDLYLMDLQTRQYRRLEINSDQSDSWHCWSSNGRWIVFASKRRDRLFGRLYFSHVGPDGTVAKPFLLPQEDPAFYGSFLDNFNAPELIDGPVRIPQDTLVGALASGAQAATDAEPRGDRGPSDPNVGAEIRELAELRQAAAKNPQDPSCQARLAQELESFNRVQEAAECYRRAIAVASQTSRPFLPALSRLAWIHATHPAESLRNGDKAVALARQACEQGGETPALLDTLAAAYAECRLFHRAIETATEAERLAREGGDHELAKRIGWRLEFYRGEQPYRSAIP